MDYLFIALHVNIFEPRYKLMVQRVVQTTRLFVYVPYINQNNSANIGDIAMIAELKDAEFLPNERYCISKKI